MACRSPLALLIGAGLAFVGLACHRPCHPSSVDAPEYQAGYARWRTERIEKLKEPEGWLALAARVWLKEGENRLGSDPANDVVFPAHAPKQIGTVTIRNGELGFVAASGVAARCGAKPVTEMNLRSDADPRIATDRIAVGSFTFTVISRGGRFALRLWDAESPTRLGFRGIDTFPLRPEWVIEGRFEPYDPPRKTLVATVIQTTEEVVVPGVVVFEIEGSEYRLEPIEEEGALFFVFADATTGHETYGGGRFLDTALPKDGKVTLDFNRAYNPPCAMTPFAACPIPRAKNRLPVRIEAGERRPAGH